MSGKHRKKPERQRKSLPLLVSGSILAGAYLSLISAGRTQEAVSEFNSGSIKLAVAPVESRAARASYRKPPKPLPLPDRPKAKWQLVVQAAMTKTGVPYVWGAKGPNAFDCSGLTKWAWSQAGVNLGNDTYAQVQQGISIPPAEVQAGDLIFPTNTFNWRGPGHVQLAISSNEVIEAPGRGMYVRVIQMPKSFVARRIS